MCARPAAHWHTPKETLGFLRKSADTPDGTAFARFVDVRVSLERSDAMRRKYVEIVMSIGAVGVILLVLIRLTRACGRKLRGAGSRGQLPN